MGNSGRARRTSRDIRDSMTRELSMHPRAPRRLTVSVLSRKEEGARCRPKEVAPKVDVPRCSFRADFVRHRKPGCACVIPAEDAWLTRASLRPQIGLNGVSPHHNALRV